MPNTATDSRKSWRGNLGRRLKEERERIDRSQTDFARHVQATKQLISHWETGRSEISVYDLYRLSLLGVDTSFVLHGGRTDAAASTAQSARLSELEKENEKLRGLLAAQLLKDALRG
jgi:transcriptional regulator with XRE-family HTH domain